jgi:hypothetical protein
MDCVPKAAPYLKAIQFLGTECKKLGIDCHHAVAMDAAEHDISSAQAGTVA